MHDKLFNDVKKFQVESLEEISDKKALIMFLTIFRYSLTEANALGHITNSAFVVNENMDKAVLVKDELFPGFVMPWGHFKGNVYPIESVMELVYDKMHLVTTPLLRSDILSISINNVDGYYKNGDYVSAHMHYDISYLLQAKDTDILSLDDEQVKVLDLDETYGRYALESARFQNRKIVRKVKSLKEKGCI